MSPSIVVRESEDESPATLPHAITGTLRDCTPGAKGRRKLRAGDIAIIDAPDITRSEAQFLIDARPAAVVNVARFSTGNLPNFGPLMLGDADIPLLEEAGATIRSRFRDGTKKGRISEHGVIFNGKNKIANATVVAKQRAETDFEEAKVSLIDHAEAFAGNAVEFVSSEASLLIDGVGVPEVGDKITGKKVLVTAPHPGFERQLIDLRSFLREFEPVIVAVGQTADTLREAGYQPTFIVGDPSDVSTESLRSGASVILAAEPDGTALGLERIQDLGVGAMTFPAAVESPLDLALFLVGHHRASMVVVAADSTLTDEVWAHSGELTPSSLFSRVNVGSRLVDADLIIQLYRSPSGPAVAWLWALLGILVAVAVVFLIVGFGGDAGFTQNLIDTWNSIALGFQGLFR